jgi:hypothetical protein
MIFCYFEYCQRRNEIDSINYQTIVYGNNVLYCSVLYCTLLYCTVLYSNVLYCTVLYCTVLYSNVLCCTVLYCTVLYSTVLYCTVLYCTVLYCTVLYCTVLYCTYRSAVGYCIWNKKQSSFNFTYRIAVILQFSAVLKCVLLALYFWYSDAGLKFWQFDTRKTFLNISF